MRYASQYFSNQNCTQKKCVDIGRILLNITSLSIFFCSKQASCTIFNCKCQKFDQQINRYFSLLVNINKWFWEKIHQQYFWSIYQQSTSKIMVKSTIYKKVCTPLLYILHKIQNKFTQTCLQRLQSTSYLFGG
jgi:hypothetical protein